MHERRRHNLSRRLYLSCVKVVRLNIVNGERMSWAYKSESSGFKHLDSTGYDDSHLVTMTRLRTPKRLSLTGKNRDGTDKSIDTAVSEANTLLLPK